MECLEIPNDRESTDMDFLHREFVKFRFVR